MKIVFSLLVTLFLVSCATPPVAEKYSADWKKDSDKLSTDFLISLGEFWPEEMTYIGLSKFDSLTIPYARDFDNKRNVHAYKWKQKFLTALEGEKNPELRIDLNILIEKADGIMKEIELEKKLGKIPFFGLTEFIYINLASLINSPNPQKSKMNSAQARFREYVRGDVKGLPVIDGYMAYLLGKLEYIESKSKRGVWPSRLEVESYIKNSDSYIKGIEALLSKTDSDDWKRDLKELVERDIEYRKFLKKKILPYCRKEGQVATEYYSWLLKSNGVNSTPDQLIETGFRDYSLTLKRFKKLAAKIAKKNSLPSEDPAEVIKLLRSRSVASNEELMKLYKSVEAYLIKIVTDKKLLSLPRPIEFVVRFASPQEMKRIPSPHFISTPYFSKQNIKSQYVIPVAGSDYSYRESLVSLTAHEAIPGHALQFQQLKDREVTIARGILGTNSASVEGWGMYAEEIVYPHLTDEEKLIVLQGRLWRQARMFLDPQVNKGAITLKRVKEVIVDQIGFSPELAQSEYERYSFLFPGQATAYYYGYKVLVETKKKVSKKEDTILDEKCFNDAVLDQGMVPLDLLSDRLMKSLNCVEN